MSPIFLNFFRMHVCARAESWKIAKLEDCKSWKIAKLEESSIQIFPATIQTRLANLSFNLFWCCPRFLQMPTISCKFYFFQWFGVLLCRPVWRLFWCPNSVFSFEVSIFLCRLWCRDDLDCRLFPGVPGVLTLCHQLLCVPTLSSLFWFPTIF